MKPINSLLQLDGQVAIVTGGAKGIGYGICYRLAEAGAHVIVADIDDAMARASAQQLTDLGWKASSLRVDVCEEADIQRMITEAGTFGPLHILVNNAGIYPPAAITKLSVMEFEHVIAVNLRSVFLATKYAAEAMKRVGGGKIINITSIDALHPSMVGLSHYDASKHGAWGFTKNAALELAADNIQVNAIAPGGIATPGVTAMQSAGSEVSNKQQYDRSQAFLAEIPMHRMGESDEIGKVALFLASDMSSYMTGSQIVVDGGALLA